MARGQGKVGESKSKVVRELPLACSDELAAVEFMERQRWGDKPACPHCASLEVYKMTDAASGERSKRFLWRCRRCRQQFTVRIGTILEDSRIPLRHWCFAFWSACSSKKGVSAKQIQRETGLSYKSALFLMHRIRFAMTPDPTTPEKLSGVVEADETWVGGRPRHRVSGNQGHYRDRLAAVMAMVERGGSVRAMPIERVDSRTLQRALLEHVDLTRSTLMTDEHTAYPAVGARFAGGHESVKHSAREYVRGRAHTNTVEGFFSLLKRGIYGTFHSVSKKHLHRYVSEFAFKYNTRRLDDGERTVRAIKGAEGKRLRYRAPA